MRNPLTDPRPGDVVEADIGGKHVVRIVSSVLAHVVYRDSRNGNRGLSCMLEAWAYWCKKHNAKVKG